MLNPRYMWKDVVKINGICYGEEAEISGKKDIVDGDEYYQIDDFISYVADKYHVDADSVKTYMLDDIGFDPNKIGFGAESCGCYIDGVPEWVLDTGKEVTNNGN